MATIAEQLTQLQNDKQVLVDNLVAKGVDASNDETFTTLVPKINDIPSGGGVVSKEIKDINFFDYEGTCLYSYTMEEFANVTELPALPEHEGLICEGWNWTLEDLKNENAPMDVGALYITDDGATRIYFELGDLRLNPYFGLGINGTVEIDWGDGSPVEYASGTSSALKKIPHTYPKAGKYMISFKVVSGEVTLNGFDANYAGCSFLTFSSGTSAHAGDAIYYYSIYKVELGSGLKANRYIFKNCYNLESVTMPAYFSISTSYYTFYNTKKLKFVTFNKSTTGVHTYSFSGSGIEYISLPNTVTFFSTQAFKNAENIQRICMPKSVTTLGQYSFQYSNLLEVVVPEKVTAIPGNCFSYLRRCTKVTCLGDIATISSQAFYISYGVMLYDFSNCTAVPTLSNKDAFSNIDGKCKIVVPDELYEDWKVADIWTNYANKITKHSEYYGG